MLFRWAFVSGSYPHRQLIHLGTARKKDRQPSHHKLHYPGASALRLPALTWRLAGRAMAEAAEKVQAEGGCKGTAPPTGEELDGERERGGPWNHRARRAWKARGGAALAAGLRGLAVRRQQPLEPSCARGKKIEEEKKSETSSLPPPPPLVLCPSLSEVDGRGWGVPGLGDTWYRTPSSWGRVIEMQLAPLLGRD